MTVWYAGAYAPAYQTVIYTEINILKNWCVILVIYKDQVEVLLIRRMRTNYQSPRSQGVISFQYNSSITVGTIKWKVLIVFWQNIFDIYKGGSVFICT